MLLLLNLLAATAMFALALFFATVGAERLSLGLLLTVSQAGLAALAALLAIILPRWRSLARLVSGLCLALLGLPAWYATIHWPGGDDGGGMAWLLLMRPACVASLVAGGFILLFGRVED